MDGRQRYLFRVENQECALGSRGLHRMEAVIGVHARIPLPGESGMNLVPQIPHRLPHEGEF